MTEPTMVTRVQSPERLKGTHPRLKWIRVLALALIGALELTVTATPARVAEAKTAHQATVKNDVVYVHSKMDTTSYVVTILRRGEQVLISRTRRTREGQWCSVTELSQKVRLGYARCKELERGAPRGPRATEKRVPEQMAKTREPGAKTRKRYTILVASLVDQGNALSVKSRVEDLGYTPVIHMVTVPITRHRVYGGDFGSRKEAERTARRLNVDGFASRLVETEGNKYSLEIGWYLNLEDARELAKSLKGKNYNPRIISRAAPTPVHQVRIGAYTDRAEALRALHALEQKGLAPRMLTQ